MAIAVSYAGFSAWDRAIVWPEVLAAALGLMLTVRIAIISITLTLGYIYRSPRPALTCWSALHLCIGECLAFLSLFLLLPFGSLWMKPDRLETGRLPLLLIHGYGCNRAVWWWFRRRLEKSGFAVATISLEPAHADIDCLGDALAQRIEAICAVTGVARLGLVGHSMGGLVARAYLRRYGSERICGLVTLATPHAGTKMAYFGFGANAKQMEPDSPWLTELSLTPLEIPAIAVRTPYDNFVIPQDNQRLQGSQDAALSALGHVALLFSPRAIALVADAAAHWYSTNPASLRESAAK